MIIQMILILVVSLAPTMAHANLVTWNITDATFYDGTTISGSFQYDTSNPTVLNSLQFSTQPGLGNFFSSTPTPMGGYAYSSTNSHGGLEYNTGRFLLNVFSLLNNDPHTQMMFSIIDWSQQYDLSAQGIHVFSPLNGNWGYEDLRVYNSDYSSYTDTTRYINSMTITTQSPVPVPGAVWLFGTGLVGLLGLKRRGHAG